MNPNAKLNNDNLQGNPNDDKQEILNFFTAPDNSNNSKNNTNNEYSSKQNDININTNSNDKNNNSNNNICFNNNNQPNSQNKNKLYSIQENNSCIYIENSRTMEVLVIEKSFNKIYELTDFTELMNIHPMRTYKVDSILGIIDLAQNNKFLLVVSSSQFITNILGSNIFNINDVELIQITQYNEVKNEKNRINGVKKLFQSKNFYYSNEIDLSLTIFNNNQNINNNNINYMINYPLLKDFNKNNISTKFYSKIIYGYIGAKNNLQLNNENNNIILDLVIIERVNKSFIFNTDIPIQIKQIEFISIYKNNNNTKPFSFIMYVSNEMINLNNFYFSPWNVFIGNELSKFNNIACLIEDSIVSNNNNDIKSKLMNIISNKNNILFNRIKLINFMSEWQKNLYIDNINNIDILISSCLYNSNCIQDCVFWFIDINNNFHENDFCFNSIIRLMWKAIQKQNNYLNLNINIGTFSKNNNLTFCDQFKELIKCYHLDLDNNKKILYKSEIRAKLQKVYDYYFNSNNNNSNSINNNLNNRNISTNNINVNKNNNSQNNSYNNNYREDDLIDPDNNDQINNTGNVNQINSNNSQKKYPNYNDIFGDNNKNTNKYPNYENLNDNNLNNNPSKNFENNNSANKNNNNINSEKLKVLCITWNVAGIPHNKNYDVTNLFTQNVFYFSHTPPDLILIGMQEIVPLDIANVLGINTNEESVNSWTKNYINTINDIFPSTYTKLATYDLVGIFFICFVKKNIKKYISNIDYSINKKGFLGTMGNKGYITFNFNYKNQKLSFGSGHFEAGQDSNYDRIQTFKEVIQKLEKTEGWFFMGDLNFRIELDFNSVVNLSSKKQFKELSKYDQYKIESVNYEIFNSVSEGKLNFPPTYKYIIGNKNYDTLKNRIPSWTDRIFYSNIKNINIIEYHSIENMFYSDHRPVIATFYYNYEDENIEKKNISNTENIKNQRVYNSANDQIYNVQKDEKKEDDKEENKKYKNKSENKETGGTYVFFQQQKNKILSFFEGYMYNKKEGDDGNNADDVEKNLKFDSGKDLID